MHVPWGVQRRLGRLIPATVKRWVGRAPSPPPRASDEERLLSAYVAGGRVPWSTGYGEYRARFVRDALGDAGLMRAFAGTGALPAGYGARMDERVVEYPWVLARAAAWGERVMDAGSTLNVPWILARPEVQSRRLLVLNLAHDWMDTSGRVSYLVDDLRRTILRDGAVDTIVCISTVEHVGLDNTMVYGAEERYRERSDVGHLQAVREMRRILRPGGRLYLTVPFGRPTVLQWMRQFDDAGLEELVAAFDGRLVERSTFRYSADGWQRADPAACADCEYYDIHSRATFDADGAAAARAVACVELERSA